MCPSFFICFRRGGDELDVGGDGRSSELVGCQGSAGAEEGLSPSSLLGVAVLFSLLSQ